MPVEEARLGGIPSDLKFRLKTIKVNCVQQGQFLCAFGQSDIELYMISAPLKHIPTPLATGWLCSEQSQRELPQTRNYVCPPEAEILHVS
jgi:hypothetical protein